MNKNLNFLRVPYWYAETFPDRSLETRCVLAYVEGLDNRGLVLYQRSYERVSEVIGIPLYQVALSVLSLRGFVHMEIGENEPVSDITGVFAWDSNYPKQEPSLIASAPQFVEYRPANIHLLRLDSACELIEQGSKLVRGERKYGYFLNQKFLESREAAKRQG